MVAVVAAESVLASVCAWKVGQVGQASIVCAPNLGLGGFFLFTGDNGLNDHGYCIGYYILNLKIWHVTNGDH